jgi:hypothetical protein|tara:strand:- start:477 stop:629 length:153 start_codon:yes stop_codon:yes gene_type:complete
MICSLILEKFNLKSGERKIRKNWIHRINKKHNYKYYFEKKNKTVKNQYGD